ncbi:MAG: porphobilinogen synthase [Planctomycetota bacterium]
MVFPDRRPRRLRATPALRSLVRETRIDADQLIQPIFVRPGENLEQPIASLPGQSQWSPDRAVEKVKELEALGVGGVMLFGIPDEKDATGTGGTDPDGVVSTALRAMRSACPDFSLIADVCLCEFTDHAHCGVIHDAAHGPDVDNDETLELLGEQAVVFADAGATMVAPSAMADGQVGVIRDALDEAGHDALPILAYSVKYASAFYGPFRDAAENTPAFGDRRTYQMDPANGREAFVEADLDLEEGADLLMVKPALAYLDVIARLRDEVDVPVAAYHVSGEYAMVHAAAERGWIDLDAALLESLLSIRRAGADVIVTYAAEWFARRD